jgi:hypothetical protein
LVTRELQEFYHFGEQVVLLQSFRQHLVENLHHEEKTNQFFVGSSFFPEGIDRTNASESVNRSFPIDGAFDMRTDVYVAGRGGFFPKGLYLAELLRKKRIDPFAILDLAPFEQDGIRYEHA